MSGTVAWLLPFALSGVLLGFLCGCAGTHIYMRSMSNITSGIAHFMIGPIGISYAAPIVYGAVFASSAPAWLGNPFLLSLLAVPIIAFLIPVDETGAVRVTQEISVLYSVGMALGFFAAFLTPSVVSFEAFLFGSLFTMSSGTVAALIIASVATLLIETLLYTRFKYIGADDVFLKLQGIRVRALHRVQLLFVCSIVVIVLQSMGILMLIAVMTIPTATAALFVKSYKALLLGSIALAVVLLTGSVIASYMLDMQLSSFAALCMGLLYFLCRLICAAVQKFRPVA